MSRYTSRSRPLSRRVDAWLDQIEFNSADPNDIPPSARSSEDDGLGDSTRHAEQIDDDLESTEPPSVYDPAYGVDPYFLKTLTATTRNSGSFRTKKDLQTSSPSITFVLPRNPSNLSTTYPFLSSLLHEITGGRLEKGCIPASFRKELAALELDDHFFSDRSCRKNTLSFGEARAILAEVAGVVKEEGGRGDKAKWKEISKAVIRTVLALIPKKTSKGLQVPDLGVVDISSKNLSVKELPELRRGKIDLGICWDFEEEGQAEYKESILDVVEGTWEGKFPNALSVDYGFLSPIHMGITVRPVWDGNLKAEVLLSKWGARTIQVLKFIGLSAPIDPTESEPDSLVPIPQLALSIVGPVWSLYIISEETETGRKKAADGETKIQEFRVCGPIEIGSLMTFQGIFKIAKFLRLVGEWANERVWPMLREGVAEGLGEANRAENLKK